MSTLAELHFPENTSCRYWKLGYRFESSGFHRHLEREFNLVTSGHGTYLMKGRNCHLEPGTLIWFDPDQDHLLADCSKSFKCWVVVFKKGFGDDFLAQLKKRRYRFDREGHLPKLGSKDIEHMENLFRLLGCESDKVSPVAASYLMEKALEFTFKPEGELCKMTEDFLSFELVKRLRKDPTIPLGVIAKDLGVSKATLCRTFQREVGLNPSDYRNKIRLFRFLEMRKESIHSGLLEQALKSGFGSYAQFHRVFRQMFGKSPKDLGEQELELSLSDFTSAVNDHSDAL